MPFDRASALTRLAGAQVASLATTRPSGSPHVVPVTFALDRETVFTMIDAKPKTTTSLQRLTNIEAHPAVSLLAQHYEDDWTGLWWVRVDGEATVSADQSVLATARRLLREKYPQHQNQPLDGPAIVIEVTDVAWWEWVR